MNEVCRLFEDYQANRARIKRLKEDKCYVTDTVKRSSVEAPYSMNPITVSGVDGLKLRANKAEIERLEADCSYVEAAIALAPNSLVRLILELKTYDGLTWDGVALRMAEDGIERSASTCKKQAYRYFEQLEKNRAKLKKK